MATDGHAEDQKKRTLEALQRRFAQAEVEVRLQQEKSKKRPREDKDRVNDSANNPSADAPTAPSSSKPSKRGNISFSGYTDKEEANDPAYCQLSHSVDKNLLGDGGEISNRRSVVDNLLHELFRQGDAAKKYMQGSKSMKIDIRIPLDTFVPKSVTSAVERFRQAHSKRSKKRMSLNQQKKCGLFHLPQQHHKFELFKPMHEMWKSYIMQLLKNVGINQLAQCLLNADLHGAVILVVQCKVNSFLGVHGIMIRETAETFGIISEDNKLRVVPKKHSVFMLQVDCWKVTLLGDKLTSRSLVL